MKFRIYIAGVMIAGIIAGLLSGCEEPPATGGSAPAPGNSASQWPPLPAGPIGPSAPVPNSRGPASPAPPIVLTKPPTLGPVGPSIVLLPPHIEEPTIRVRLTDAQDLPPTIAKGKYRGRIEILKLTAGASAGKFVAINILPLDSYLQGVLAKELYGSWEPATYRAQAIAARTFALYSMVTDGVGKPWDVNNDESSQMYGGIAGETAKSKSAVADTHGEVLTAVVNGKTGIFCSRYSACIGGASQDPFDAWGDSTVGPLQARNIGNVDANCDKYQWDRDFVATRADVTRCIKSWGERNGFAYLKAMGTITSINITKRNEETNRPTELTLTDAAGKSAPIRAEEFRIALLTDPAGKAPKIFSSNCDIRAAGDTFIMYNGKGYGHGIGLSQWGAQNLAKEGKTSNEILGFFYPGAGLAQLW